jgi:hypothetical protein
VGEAGSGFRYQVFHQPTFQPSPGRLAVPIKFDLLQPLGDVFLLMGLGLLLGAFA